MAGNKHNHTDARDWEAGSRQVESTELGQASLATKKCEEVDAY